MDDLDISATEAATFTVEPIPPFAKPNNAHTKGGALFNTEYLRHNHEITFEWDTVPRAQGYILEVLNDKNKTVFTENLKGNKNTNFELRDLTMLSKGIFSWRVRAVRMASNEKTILIDGIPAENQFTVDYTINTAGGNRKHNGELYAQ